jgi:hypothetical protein
MGFRRSRLGLENDRLFGFEIREVNIWLVNEVYLVNY